MQEPRHLAQFRIQPQIQYTERSIDLKVNLRFKVHVIESRHIVLIIFKSVKIPGRESKGGIYKEVLTEVFAEEYVDIAEYGVTAYPLHVHLALLLVTLVVENLIVKLCPDGEYIDVKEVLDGTFKWP